MLGILSWNRLRRSTVAMLLLIVTVFGSVVGAAIFSQSIPTVTIPSNGAHLTSNCATTLNETNPTPLTGAIVFGCGVAPGTPAFTVAYATQGVPVFALSSGAGETAFLHYVSSASQCIVTLNTGNMTTGQASTFTGPGSFFYCETYYNVNPNGEVQGSFSVSWA